jgi:hypothetical protein
MIADIVGSYLDTVEEREFDAPFMALLRSLGFYDIHFLHGSFEFGKDFIAKQIVDDTAVQYVFQTKAGNLGLTEWSGCRGQIDLLRTNVLAHPSFDSALPRKAVFVTTGRLVGGATLAAQQYGEHLSQLGELGFVTWDREKLIELMVQTPEVGLASSIDGPMLELLGHIDQGRIREDEIEQFSRRWFSSAHPITLETSALEATVVANRLRRHNRIDQACLVSLGLIRAAWVKGNGGDPPDPQTLSSADTGRALFRHYALDLFNDCGEDLLEPLNVVHSEVAAHLTYPARCLRLIEILGLLALLEFDDSDATPNLGKFLAAFIEKNPGTGHPVSDRWSVSLIPPTLALARLGYRQQIESLLKRVIKWVADHYEGDNLGLAGPDASAETEVNHFLGNVFEHVQIEKRSQSYIATAILDLASVLEMGELFALARNEFQAVEVYLPLVESPDSSAQYLAAGQGLIYNANMEFADVWRPTDKWKVAPHHRRATPPYLLRIGRPWDLMAVSALLRDRHFIDALRFFGAPRPSVMTEEQQ